MKLTTSRNKEYDVIMIGGPTRTSGSVMMEMRDDRRLPEIAAEFDGLDWMKRESKTEGNKEYTGFSVLRSIQRQQGGTVLLSFARE